MSTNARLAALLSGDGTPTFDTGDVMRGAPDPSSVDRLRAFVGDFESEDEHNRRTDELRERMRRQSNFFTGNPNEGVSIHRQLGQHQDGADAIDFLRRQVGRIPSVDTNRPSEGMWHALKDIRDVPGTLVKGAAETGLDWSEAILQAIGQRPVSELSPVGAPHMLAPAGSAIAGFLAGVPRNALTAGGGRQSSSPVPPQFHGTAPESPVQKGMRDDTGAWFLEGDKPIYTNATREGLDRLFGTEYARRFDSYPSIVTRNYDGTPHTTWYKPDELARAEAISEYAARPVTDWTTRHREYGRLLGYSDDAIDNWITAVNAPKRATQDVPANEQIVRLLSANPKGGQASLPGVVGNALAMDDPSRLARAREMGFDTDQTWYHGTNKTFDAFDPARIGARHGDYPFGFHLTNDSAEAGHYGGNILELFSRARNPLVVDAPKHGASMTADLDRVWLHNQARTGGHDAVLVRGRDGNENLVVFDPALLRSVDAAFNPRRKRSSNLLAVNPYPASIPGIVVNTDDDRR